MRNLKFLLEKQSDAYKSNILIVQDEIKELRKLKKSLEFSQKTIVELEKKIDKLERTNHHNDDLKNEIANLNIKVNRQEDYTRRNNLKIDGIEELTNENTEQTQKKIEDFIKNKLKIDSFKIDVAHRL